MSIIDNYKSLPLGKYLDICQVCKDESLEEIERQVKILSILSDMTEEEILHLPIPKYKEMVVASRFLEDVDKNRHKAARLYIVGNWKLLPTMDYRKMETAQYVDFQTFAPMVETHMAELLSCLLVPVGCRYNEGYDILEVQQALKDNLSVTDALSLSAFFLTKYRNLIKDSLNSCRQEVRTIKDKSRRSQMEEKIRSLENLLQTNGAGSQM